VKPALALLCVLLLAAPPLLWPADADPTIRTCQDWGGGAPVGCSDTFPQGAPWLVYDVRGIPPGRYALQRTSQRFTGTALIMTGADTAYLTNTDRVPPPAGSYTVTVTDQSSGRVVAQAKYTVTPQTPQEAWTMWQAGHGDFETMGAAVAAWRLDNTPKAVDLSRSLLVPGHWGPGVLTAYSLIYTIAMAERDYATAIDETRALMNARRQAFEAHQTAFATQPLDYVWLGRALVAACRLTEAQSTLTEALRAYPKYDQLVALTGRLENARSTCP
jgi:hypothetical protein